ncbi:uncharacterized protein LOC125043208 isoform X1 [Penaeus chinensis]|uniref:uncharacterized protein LOC125043208 isoform X1 n=1 Tax=Penaeus chinensis TaxID=139456 RepID=UPI001FB79140|nr:uncharacterized protein LOC125043208 isoform X1 [Penaeus chinensis]
MKSDSTIFISLSILVLPRAQEKDCYYARQLQCYRRRATMAGEVKWLWKSTLTESYFEPLTTCYQLGLSTHEPLLEKHVIQALRHLYRKVPSLRACYGDRHGERWMKEMAEEIIDFEVISDATIDNELHHSMHNISLNNDKGPLWCARLLPGVAEFNVSEFPNVCTLFLVVNHSISDGTSNMKTCGFFVQLLDAVIAGKPIDDKEQLGVFVSDEKTQKLIQEQLDFLEANPDLMLKTKEEVRACQSIRSLVKLTYKGVGDVMAKTLTLTKELDPDATASFIKRCRAEGVTVNSAFAALASITTVDILVEGGLEQDTYTIRGDHLFNARRYWGGDTSQYLGCQVLPLKAVLIETPRSVGENFWDFARLTHQKLLKKIKGVTALQEEAIKAFVPKNPDFNPQWEFEFVLTNMGDVTETVTEGGQNVDVINVIRSVCLQTAPIAFDSFIHSFRGRFIHTLVYNSAFISPKMAKYYCEKILNYIRKFI